MSGTGCRRDGNDRTIRVLADNVLDQHAIRRSLCDHRLTTPLPANAAHGASSLIPPVAARRLWARNIVRYKVHHLI